MRISIVGTGYVGLVSGACLADQGHDVVCVDIDPRKVEMINSAVAPIHEDGLPEILRRHCGKGLRATTDLKRAVLESEMTFIAVGTPAVAGKIDLQYVVRVAEQIGTALRDKDGYHVVVVKSTVIPGTTTGVVKSAVESASGKQAGRDFGLGMNPEFLTEGTAVEDFSRPDRLVLGGIDGRTHEALQALYASFDAAVPRVLTNPTTAEMIKYASNAVLATMISYSNEIARLCSAVGGVDAIEVVRGVHLATYFTSRREGERIKAGIASFLEPGCGFGGSCLPKDVAALIGQGEELGLKLPLLRSVLEINAGQPDEVMRLIARHFPDLKNRSVAILGLAFKPDTDDVRESPAFPLIRRLRAAGAQVIAYDPVVKHVEAAEFADIKHAGSLPEVVAQVEIVILVTRWAEFSNLAATLDAQGRKPLIVDGRRVLDPVAFARYEGIGR